MNGKKNISMFAVVLLVYKNNQNRHRFIKNTLGTYINIYIVHQNEVFSVKLLFQTTRGSNSVSKNWAQVLMPYQVLAELSWGFAGPVSQGPGGRSSGTWWRLGKIFWQKNCCSTAVLECPHGPSILLDILSRTIDEVMMVQCISTNRVHVKDQIHHLIIRMQFFTMVCYC